jgi:tetratricopeptide (TPR) repeat protein
VCVVGVLLCVQLASDALYRGMLPRSFGLAVYRALDRVAPASFVEETLGEQALRDGDPALAQRYAVRMPASERRDALLSRIAAARGQDVLAQEYAFAADDLTTLQDEVTAMAPRDPAGALALEQRIRSRLIALTTHPDAVAESYWITGNLEAQRANLSRALVAYQHAESLAPLDMKYILAVANTALDSGRLARAQAMYQHGRSVAPANADMVAGLGLVALHRGNRAAAQRALARARQLDANSGLTLALGRALR